METMIMFKKTLILVILIFHLLLSKEIVIKPDNTGDIRTALLRADTMALERGGSIVIPLDYPRTGVDSGVITIGPGKQGISSGADITITSDVIIKGRVSVPLNFNLAFNGNVHIHEQRTPTYSCAKNISIYYN